MLLSGYIDFTAGGEDHFTADLMSTGRESLWK
jgi:hypothetical protein